MAVKKLVQIGDPVLQEVNQEIADCHAEQTVALINSLKDTMYKTGLIGIAAPQIGENFQVFLTHPRNTKSRVLEKEDSARVYNNPEIVYSSDEKILMHEGCGSVEVGEIFGPVLRPKHIRVEALDENGEKFSLECDGILARVIQHEYDHLMRVTFLEKVSDYTKVMVKKYYKKTIRKSEDQKNAAKITVSEYKKV